MVTHDRYFLDRVVNKIVEIDRGKLYTYDTNYSGFLELKQQRLESEKAGYRKVQSILRTARSSIFAGARSTFAMAILFFSPPDNVSIQASISSTCIFFKSR